MDYIEMSYWFDDNFKIIGKLPANQIIDILNEMDDFGVAGEFEKQIIDENSKERNFSLNNIPLFSRQIRPWEHTSHSFGYIPVSSYKKSDNYLDIQHAINIKPDNKLKGKRIKITLDQFRIADYPGKGEHIVLCDFYAQNQIENQTEHLHFNQIFRAMDGESVAIIGYPIFLGLNVGNQGVSLKCFTVNVKNKEDKKMLNLFENDVFKCGLKLVNIAQPAIAPLTNLALNLTKLVAKRNRNVPVQDFYLGLDFSKNSARAKLAEGSYIAMQMSEDDVQNWNWQHWFFDKNSGRIVKKNKLNKTANFNYIVFGVSKYEGP